MTVIGILNIRLVEEIQFHDTLHGFHIVMGIGNASLEEKMPQKLTAMR